MQTSDARVADRPVRDLEGVQLTRQDRANLLRYMVMMRASEERALNLYKQGKVPGSFYDGRGQEAVSVGAAYALGPRDRTCILHRDLGAHLVRGVTPDRYLANYMGRAGGVTEGKEGNMHFGDRRLGSVGMVSMLPDMALVAGGMALAFKLRGEPRVAMTFFGEGSTANGQWHEAMNYAGIHRLPVVFVLENNRFAYSTPNELEFAVDPVERAHTYGFPGVGVDGNDVEAVFDVARVACSRARAGGGPTLIECQTMRMHGHGAHDDMSYVPKEMLEEWGRRDPIDRYAERLVADRGFASGEVEEIRSEVQAYVDECAARAVSLPMPEAALATEGVFADAWEPLGDGRAPWSHWEHGNGERRAA
jgi:TPP-dependent pyruvate/acetoin dehydrogenase alpha subunit